MVYITHTESQATDSLDTLAVRKYSESLELRGCTAPCAQVALNCKEELHRWCFRGGRGWGFGEGDTLYPILSILWSTACHSTALHRFLFIFLFQVQHHQLPRSQGQNMSTPPCGSTSRTPNLSDGPFTEINPRQPWTINGTPSRKK